MEYLDEYKKWCNDSIFDEETKKELKEIENNEKEIEDRFYKELEFGTAEKIKVLQLVSILETCLQNLVKKQH